MRTKGRRAFEKFFHVFRVTAEGFRSFAVVEFDGTDRTQGFFVAENEVDGFLVNETIGGFAVLATDFMTE